MEGFKEEQAKERNKKTAYFSNFAMQHLSDMRILRKGGILGKENADWRNVSEHIIAESVGVDILAEALGADRESVVRAANLHDWYKRREVEAMKKSGGGEGYSATTVEDERLLHKFGVASKIIELAHANIPKSADEKYLSHRTTEEKIIHYMDLITSGSEFINFRDRIAVAAQKKHNIEFSESFRAKYGGKSLFEFQEELIQREETEFEEQLGLPKGGLIPFIMQRLEERIEKA